MAKVPRTKAWAIDKNAKELNEECNLAILNLINNRQTQIERLKGDHLIDELSGCMCCIYFEDVP